MSWAPKPPIVRGATGTLNPGDLMPQSSVVVGGNAYLHCPDPTNAVASELIKFDLSTMSVVATQGVSFSDNVATVGSNAYSCDGSQIAVVVLATMGPPFLSPFAAHRIEVSGLTGYGIQFGSPTRIREISLSTLVPGTVTNLSFNSDTAPLDRRRGSALAGNTLVFGANGSQSYLCRFDIATSTQTGLLTLDSEVQGVHLDSTATWAFVVTQNRFYRINVSRPTLSDQDVETMTYLPRAYQSSGDTTLALTYDWPLPPLRGFAGNDRWGLVSSGHPDLNQVGLFDFVTGQLVNTTTLAADETALQYAFSDGTDFYVASLQAPIKITTIDAPPDEPCINGFDWDATQELDLPVTNVGVGSVAWTLESSVTEDIETLWTYDADGGEAAGDVIDIYDVDDLRPTTAITRTYFPTADNGGVRPLGYRWDGTRPVAYDAGVSTFFDKVDDSFFTPADNFQARIPSGTNLWGDPQYVVNRQFIGLTAWDANTSTTTYWSGRSEWNFFHANLNNPVAQDEERILRVGIRVLGQRLVNPSQVDNETDYPYTIRLGIVLSGIAYMSPQIPLPSTLSTIEYFWPINPYTDREWSYNDIAQLGSPGHTRLEMRRPNEGPVVLNSAGAIYRFEFVTEATAETRSGVALRSNYRSIARGWNQWAVTQPDSLVSPNTLPFRKQIDRTYLLNQRLDTSFVSNQRLGLNVVSRNVRALSSDGGAVNGIVGVSPFYTDGVPFEVGDEQPFVPAIMLRGPAPDVAFSFDSQPYAEVADNDGTAQVRATSDSAVAQEVWFDPQSFSPDRIRVTVRGADKFGQVPDSRLWIRVYNGSVTSSGLEATIGPITGDQLSTASEWTEFDLAITGASWASGADYKHIVVFTVDGGEDAWEVLTVEDTGEDATNASLFDSVTSGFGYRGASWYDTLTGSGWVRDDDRVVYVLFGQQPDTPTGLTATLRDWDSAPGYGQHVELEWDGLSGSEECSTLGRYEVQRLSETADASSPFYSGWQTIFTAEVDGSDATYLTRDYEAIRHSAAVATNKYRVRTVNDFGFVSPWSSPVTVTVDPDDRCQYSFVSNTYPPLNQWYTDVGERDYRLLEEVTYYEFEDRDGAQPLRPAVDRLDEFTLGLLVAADGAVSPTPDIRNLDERGRRRFDLLAVLSGNKRSLELADTLIDFDGLMRLPYIAVLDNRGNRWFADLQVTEGVESEPGGRHRYNVTVRETTRVPAPVVLELSSGELISDVYRSLTVAAAAPAAPSDPAIPVLAEAPDFTLTGAALANIEAGGYRVAVWTSSGSFVLNSGTLDVEWFIVGGGGAGGGSQINHAGGGGGGGGVVTNEGSPVRLTPGTYTVTVGAGATGVDAPTIPGNGNASSFGSLASAGGGGSGGLGWGILTRGQNGASGGGGGSTTFATGNGGLGTAGQGYQGGRAQNLLGVHIGGGGGGAYESADRTNSGSSGGWPGQGVYNNWTVTYGDIRFGGGGRSGRENATYGSTPANNPAASYKGSFSGGQGSTSGDGSAPNPLYSFAGGGGGGAGGGATGDPHKGGDGGDGIVMVRWKEVWT